MSCASVTFSLPSLASVTVWGLIILLTAYFSFHAGKLYEERSNRSDLQKRSAWLIRSPHMAEGEPIVVTRTDPRETIFKERRFDIYSGPYITEPEYKGPDERIAA